MRTKDDERCMVLVDKALWDELQSYKDRIDHEEELENNSTILKKRLDETTHSFKERIDQLELSLHILKRSTLHAYNELNRRVNELGLRENFFYGRRVCKKCLAYGRIALENSSNFKLCDVCMGRGHF